MPDQTTLPKGHTGTIQRGTYAGKPYVIEGRRQDQYYTVRITTSPTQTVAVAMPYSLLMPKPVTI